LLSNDLISIVGKVWMGGWSKLTIAVLAKTNSLWHCAIPDIGHHPPVKPYILTVIACLVCSINIITIQRLRQLTAQYSSSLIVVHQHTRTINMAAAGEGEYAQALNQAVGYGVVGA
jgi:hypothetical protein